MPRRSRSVGAYGADVFGLGQAPSCGGTPSRGIRRGRRRTWRGSPAGPRRGRSRGIAPRSAASGIWTRRETLRLLAAVVGSAAVSACGRRSPTASGHVQSASSQGGKGVPAGTKIVIRASDANDQYSRFWELDDDTSGTTLAKEAHNSGDIMTITVTTAIPAGDKLTLHISQTGGSSYGTYSGTIQIGNRTIQFDGVDAGNPFTFSV
jgi:hypothetical protein